MGLGKSIEKGLVFGITALFIISSFSQMTTGYAEIIADKELIEDSYENYAFVRFDGRQTSGSSNYEKYFYTNHTDDAFNVEKSTVSGQTCSTDEGPMDSPWPMKCHDNHHTSQSPYSTADNPGDEKWRVRSIWDGTVESSAIIGDDGTIYFGTMGTDCRLYALYPNGTIKWNYNLPNLIWSTPAIAEDGTIYVTSYDAELHALYSNNGTLKWRIGGGGSISSSPAIAEDGTIYFGVMGPGDKGRISAINPNGTRKWEYDTGYWIVSDPAIGDDGTIYIGSGDTYLYALYPNGTLRWRFKTGDIVKSHPSIADDGTIYFASFDLYLYALNPNGTLKWKRGGDYSGASSVAIGNDGTIYSNGNSLIAIYPNGTTKWSLDLGGDPGHASPAISNDGTIYICTDEGKHLVAINLNGTEKWRREICNLRADSSPIIDEDGTIYVGSSWEDENTHRWFGYLHAFGRGELEADANGPYYGLINESVQFNGTASGGYRPYSWLWDFGDGNTSDERNPIHTYTIPGNYTVTLIISDDSGNTSDDSTWAWIQESNNPPDRPSINGETNGKVGQSYDYTFFTTDLEGLQVWYYIEWGDGNTGWLGPYASGKEIIKSHSWPKKDTYIIRCKAKDPYEDESEWGTLEVTMPFNRQTTTFPWIHQFLECFPRMFPMIRWLFELK